MKPIPDDMLRLEVGRCVHVEGWGLGPTFIYLGTDNGVHRLKTPVSNRRLTTRNRLMYSRRNEPKG